MAATAKESVSATFRVEEGAALTFHVAGRLDAASTAHVWRETDRRLGRGRHGRVVVDASGIEYCDGAGTAWFIELQRRQREAGGKLEILGLAPEYQALLNLYGGLDTVSRQPPEEREWSLTADVGRGAAQLARDMVVLIAFVGELTYNLLAAAISPRRLRWKDTFLTMETAGVNALPIVALIGFLMGLIMAFQATVPMRKFGVDVYAADLVSLSMIRELGALMTAIVLAGRSGSAFAAEIGTMKINEEIDALKTMALDPARFLVTPRVVAAVIMTPLLTLFAVLFGLIGGGVVMLSLGYPLATYINHITFPVTATDLLGGLFKSLVFGLLVAGIGCLRGLRTRTGAMAVGASTTSAVVSGIVLIAVFDGIFAVVYYYLGI